MTFKDHTNVSCYGYLPKNMPVLPSRHLGLVPSCEIENLKENLHNKREIFENISNQFIEMSLNN